MSFSQALEVVIGLIFIYYVLGSIVSLFTQWINEALETRGKSLEKHLIKIVGDKNVGDFVKLPQLQSLRPIRYKNWYSFLTSATEPKKLEKVPAATLVESYFDFMGLTVSKEFELDELKMLINAFPESEGKQAMLKWVSQGVTKVEDLRKRTTAYFTGLMDQAAATFRSNARSFVIMLSILLTLLLGTDSIQMAQALWENAGLRALVVAKAEEAVQQETKEQDIEKLFTDLGELKVINIGWFLNERPEKPADAMDWVKFVLMKLAGLGLTMAAVSQGSSFWYDLLKKLVSPSKSGGGGGGGGESGEAKG
ncbi:MAG: hypothetical protein L6Q49_05990 [Anaerolineales bacterium]|nr:hypothetical protein [Chloroflexi bacterium CFX2]MCK6582633.1 hypothetical protein [Anaerolineales bacterium]